MPLFSLLGYVFVVMWFSYFSLATFTVNKDERELCLTLAGRFITMLASSSTSSGGQLDLRTLRAVRVLRPLKFVSGVPS